MVDDRFSSANVDAHAEQCVDHAQRVGAAFHGRAGRHGDVGDVRRELDNHLLVGELAQAGDQTAQRHRISADAHTSGGHVRAAHVDFQHVCRRIVQLGHDFDIVVVAVTGHIGDDRSVDGLELGQVVFQIMVHTRVLQADRVDVAGWAFSGTNAGIAFPWHRGDALGGDRAQLAHVVEPADRRILEGAGSRGDRILPRHARHLRGMLPLVRTVQVLMLGIVDHLIHPIPNVRE